MFGVHAQDCLGVERLELRCDKRLGDFGERGIERTVDVEELAGALTHEPGVDRVPQRLRDRQQRLGLLVQIGLCTKPVLELGDLSGLLLRHRL